eukprot:gene7279-395_t
MGCSICCYGVTSTLYSPTAAGRWTTTKNALVSGIGCSEADGLPRVNSFARSDNLATSTEKLRERAMNYGTSRGRGGKNVDIESLERDNDKGIDSLSDRVNMLKQTSLSDRVSMLEQATMGIKGEVDGQHRLLDDMDGGMVNTRGFLTSINDKLSTVMSTKQGQKMGMIVGASVLLLILFWYFKG